MKKRLKHDLKVNYIKALKHIKKRVVKHSIQDKSKENPRDEDLPLTIIRGTSHGRI